MSTIDKLNRLSLLAKETIGASFDIRHHENGTFKVDFTAKKNAPKTCYFISDFDKMLDEAINYILENRRPAPVQYNIKKAFTLHKF